GRGRQIARRSEAAMLGEGLARTVVKRNPAILHNGGNSAVGIKSGIERIAGAESWRLAGEGSGRSDFGVGLAMESLQPALRAERSAEAAGSDHGWLAGG